MENIAYQAGAFLPGPRMDYHEKNKALKKAYAQLIDAGVTKLYYVSCDKLLGSDGEATVDGTHPTDLGFMRFAEALEPILKGVLAGR